MGYIYWQQGQPERTAKMLRQVIQIDREILAVAQEAGHMYNLAVVLHQSLGGTTEAIELITGSIAILEQHNLPQDANGGTLAQHRAFLAQMRGETSPAPNLPPDAQAIADAIVAFVNTPNWDAAKAQVEQRAALLLRPEADDVFQAIIQGQSDAKIIEMLEDHRAVLALCREHGIEGAFRRLAASPQNRDSELQAILEAIAAFVQTPNWEAAKAQVEQHADLLLRPDADEVFQTIIDNAPEGTPPESIEMLRQHRTVLALCREHGIDEAFRRLGGG
jgi:tetratricopeptide (TPR) repeat protein